MKFGKFMLLDHEEFDKHQNFRKYVGTPLTIGADPSQQSVSFDVSEMKIPDSEHTGGAPIDRGAQITSTYDANEWLGFMDDVFSGHRNYFWDIYGRNTISCASYKTTFTSSDGAIILESPIPFRGLGQLSDRLWQDQPTPAILDLLMRW